MIILYRGSNPAYEQGNASSLDRTLEVTCENCPNLTMNQHEDREMRALPTGTVTFLFTDIEGSTALWERDRAAMREAVTRYLTILHSLIAAHHGVLYNTIGDGTQAAFASAEDALRASDPPGVLQVRMALHAG